MNEPNCQGCLLLPVFGWDKIGKILGVHRRTAEKYRKELLEEKIIYFARRGRPPRLFVCSYPFLLMEWRRRRSARTLDEDGKHE